MNKLTPSMCALIKAYSAGCVGSVNDDGTPSVSPKATFLVIDGGTIAFGDIRSPGTVYNLRARPAVEVNFVDVLTRRAVRVCGRATVVEKDCAEGEELVHAFTPDWGPFLDAIERFVSISITDAQMILSPAYDLGVTLEELKRVNFEKLRSLT
jgi:uncharacterized protein